MTTDRTQEADAVPADVARSGDPAAIHTLPKRLGRYLLTHRLGVGGMAEVFLAQQDGPAGFQKTCVVKKILPHLALEPRFVTMFQREARVAALLHHTNVVQTFELAEERGVYFIAMEYVDGPPLHTLARAAWSAGKPLPMELVACALADCALGLAAAHALTGADGKPLRLIHRDISPDNLIINTEGVTKILDFGVAKIDAGERTATGELKGKVPFMAPEQIRGDAVDERVDLYALGVTAYWLLTGARPFSAPTDLALMQAILAERPAPPRALNPAIPAELEALVLRMLEKDPDDRPRRASDIADALAETTSARRRVVAPFVKEIAALRTAGDSGSSPRDPAVRAAEPTSSSFIEACHHILASLPPPPHESPTVRAAIRPASTTQPSAGDLLATAADATADTADGLDAASTKVLTAPTAPRQRRSATPVIAATLAAGALLGVALWAWPRAPEADDAAHVQASAPPAPAARSEPGPALATLAEPAEPPAPAPADANPAAAPANDTAATAAATDEPEPAAADPPEKVRTSAKRRAEAAIEIEARAPASIQWLDVRGRSLGAGTTRLSIHAGDKTVVAYDRTRGVRTTIAVGPGPLDYAALPRGKLQLRANPYADVTLGKEKLGTTPFPPVDVVAGSYTVRFSYQGKEETRVVEVAPGATVRAAADFGG